MAMSASRQVQVSVHCSCCSLLLCRGFTAYTREDYLTWKKEGRMVNDGVNAKVRTLQSPAEQPMSPATVSC